MQIVIDIDEDTYRYMQSRCKYQNKGDKGLSKFEEAGVAIKNGTPLPKGHGRLIDADKLYNDYVREPEEFKGGRSLMNLFREASTIIKADTESEDKK